MARRIFVALPMSSVVHSAIAEWKKQYRNLPVRWIAPKNLHVTIIPPWEDDVDAILDVLRTVEGTIGAFSVSYNLVRYGPAPREPRLIWAEGEAPDQLFALKHGVERALTRNPETRPFRLHLTLARFDPDDFKKFTVRTIADTVSWADTVTSFALMESHLAPAGADYTVLGEFKL